MEFCSISDKAVEWLHKLLMKELLANPFIFISERQILIKIYNTVYAMNKDQDEALT